MTKQIYFYSDTDRYEDQIALGKTPKLKIGDKNFNSRKLTPSTLLKQDLVLIITDHTYFDFNFIKKHSKVIIDTRGVYKKLSKGIFRA